MKGGTEPPEKRAKTDANIPPLPPTTPVSNGYGQPQPHHQLPPTPQQLPPPPQQQLAPLTAPPPAPQSAAASLPPPPPLPSPQRPNPLKWNVGEVCDFIKALPGCSEYVEEFAAQEIDGQALMLLKADHLMTAMAIKLGPALKICSHIEQIREELNRN
jgi:hypothetical protein